MPAAQGSDLEFGCKVLRMQNKPHTRPNVFQTLRTAFSELFDADFVVRPCVPTQIPAAARMTEVRDTMLSSLEA